MKKVLIVMFMALMSLSSVHGSTHAMKHVSPLPNLVRIALGNAELLQLNEKQVKDIKSWVKTNRPTIKTLVKTVIEKEKSLRVEALTTDKNVVKNAESMLDARRQIIAIKTKCRAYLRSVLSEKQYAQVIGIYKSTTQPMK